MECCLIGKVDAIHGNSSHPGGYLVDGRVGEGQKMAVAIAPIGWMVDCANGIHAREKVGRGASCIGCEEQEPENDRVQ